MKTSTIQFNFDTAKLEALNIYMKDKEGTLQSELESFMDQIYKKYVPGPVREFIEKKEDSPAPTKPRRGKRQASATEKTDFESTEKTIPQKNKVATQGISGPVRTEIETVKD